MDREERRETVRRLTLEGSTAREIARRLDCTMRTVQRDRKATGVALKKPPHITAEEWAQAEALLDDGASIAEAARTIGHSAVALHKRFPGRAWSPRQRNEWLSIARQLRGVK